MLNGFASIVDSQARLLILGSMPSITSLSQQEYYAHPQNRFWKVLGEIYQGSFETYQDKIQALHDQGLALWDVIAACERQGSLDSNIVNERCNDVIPFLENYPNIKKIICNGKKAGAFVKKTYGDKLRIPFEILPSTSPANASYSLEKLTELWREALQ